MEAPTTNRILPPALPLLRLYCRGGVGAPAGETANLNIPTVRGL